MAALGTPPGVGTAPRRVSPGVWKTRKGRTLTPEGGAYWENLYRTGHTDGRGHMRTPSVVQKAASKPAPKRDKEKPAERPLADTFKLKKHHGGSPLGRFAHGVAGAAEAAGEGVKGTLSQAFPGPWDQQPERVGPMGSPIPGVSPSTIQRIGGLEKSASSLALGPDLTNFLTSGPFSPLGLGIDAAAILPFGAAGKAGRAAKAAEKAARAEEAAAQAARMARREAKAGSGVEDFLSAARGTYEEQAGLRSEELAKRVQRAGRAEELAGGGKAGVKAALGELEGALPHLRFDALTHLTEPEVETLIKSVDAHPNLQFFDSLRTKIALWDAAEGKAITPSQIKLIEEVFGKQAADKVAKSIPLGSNVLRTGGEILNIPRSILSSFDVSGVLRQALVASIHHPVIAAKNTGPMFRMLFDEKYFNQIMHGIGGRPNANNYVTSGLKLTDLGDMAHREEGFMSNFAEKIPALGHIIRGSGRGYTGFLNMMRADIFDTFLEGAVAAGRPNTPELRRQIANQVNVWTGRGGLGKYGERAAVPLNTLFFSPRLFSSRVQTFATPFYKDLDPYVRKQAALAATKLVASGSTLLFLAWLAGAKTTLDPRNADWGKIKIGNTRFDIWGGHQQIAKLIAQVSTGSIISSTTGKTLHVGNQFGDMNRPEIAWRFVRGKFSPGSALVYNWFAGTDYQGKPFSWKKAALKNAFPLLLQDIKDVQRDTGNPLFSAATFGVGAFGVGVQNYGPKKPKAGGTPSLEGSHPAISGGPKRVTPTATRQRRGRASATHPSSPTRIMPGQ